MRLVGKHPLEGTGDLLGRPLPVQQGAPQAPGLAVHVQHGRRACSASARVARLLRHMGAADPAKVCIARKLTVDGGRRASQHAGHGSHAAARCCMLAMVIRSSG
jgi:hypothetical protein